MFVHWKLESSTKAAFVFKITRIRIQIKPPLQAALGNHEMQNDTAVLEKSSADFLLSMFGKQLTSCPKGGSSPAQRRFQEHNSIWKGEQPIPAHGNHPFLEFDSSKNSRSLSKTAGIGVPPRAGKARSSLFSLNFRVTI